MAIVYRADKANGCTIAVWDGDLTDTDMQQQLIRLANDADWPPGPRHLIDGTTLGTITIPDPQLLDVLHEDTYLLFERKVRIAVVVRPAFVEAAAGRYKKPLQAFDAAVFTDLNAACAYLELDPTAVQPVIDQLRRSLPTAAA